MVHGWWWGLPTAVWVSPFLSFFLSFFWLGALHYLANVNGHKHVMFESKLVYFKHKPYIFNGRILEYHAKQILFTLHAKFYKPLWNLESLREAKEKKEIKNLFNIQLKLEHLFKIIFIIFYYYYYYYFVFLKTDQIREFEDLFICSIFFSFLILFT